MLQRVSLDHGTGQCRRIFTAGELYSYRAVLGGTVIADGIAMDVGGDFLFKRTIFISSRHGLCFSADYRILFGNIKRLSVANMDFIRNGIGNGWRCRILF